MPFGMARNPNPATPAASSQSITRAFALTILAALLLLIIMRHLFGSIRVEVGTH